MVTAMASHGNMPSVSRGHGVSEQTSDMPLTRENLARPNALNGTAEDDDIGGAYLFVNDSNETIKKIYTADSIFEGCAYENGILNPTTKQPPAPNLNAIQDYSTKRGTNTQPSKRACSVYLVLVYPNLLNGAGAATLSQLQLSEN